MAPWSVRAPKNLPHLDAAADSADDKPVQIDAGGQDPVLRYAVLGLLVILATAALHITQAITLPIVAGVIFGLVLGPISDRLVRHGIPQHLAAALVVLTGVGLTVALLILLAVPIAAWSDQWPAMMAALQLKLGIIFSGIQQFESTLESFSTSSGLLVSVAGSSPLMNFAVSSSAAAAGLLLFVATTYFYLASHRYLKARALRLFLTHDARKSADTFFEEIEYRVSAYLGVVTVINFGLGLVATAIAWLAGLPFPIFWGAMAFLLNYVAFVGPILVAILLFAATILSAKTVFAGLWPAATFYCVHLIESNAITPAVVGNRLTVSPFLVFLSFVFWLWLWGPIGAILSTPILLIGMVGLETLAEYRADEPTQPTAPTFHQGTDPAAARFIHDTKGSDPGSRYDRASSLSRRLAMSNEYMPGNQDAPRSAIENAYDETKAAASRIRDGASEIQETVVRGAGDLASGVNQKLKDAGVDTDGMVDAATVQAGELRRLISDELRTRPLRALGIAAGVGLVVGFMATR